ncbi:MAG: peptidase [Microbacteriaceae bacterium]|nr:peptidase [Microbacteriaceae bacterium]
MRVTTASRPFRLAAAAIAAVMLLSGCVSAYLPKAQSSTSKPTGESVIATLTPYYGQVLKWSSCEGGDFQCATAKAPLDWNDPARSSIDLALIRSNSTGTARGSLLVNPGGPGASGYDFVRDGLTTAVDSRLRQNYDIVGFDPRGVNKSSAISCYSDPAEMDAFLFGLSPNPFGSDAWIADQEAASQKFGASCLQHTGELLGYVDTMSAARDLDMLRAALGDKKLNYLGYSYGTLLGATYAELYPGKTGRLVLDGAVDPATTSFEVTKVQAAGFESALTAYLTDCRTSSDCPFKGSVASALKKIRALLSSLDASPLRASDGRQLGSASMFTAIILPLYNKANWPALNELFTSVGKGDADYAFELADNYYGRKGDGTYTTNSSEAIIAINCLDYRTTSTEASLRGEAAQLIQVAPTLGAQMSYGGTSCARWPYQSTRDPGPIAAAGSAPIVVVGTTNDPATPYVWAKALASELQEGHLVTYRGEGHTAYNKSNQCVNDAVDNFLIQGTVPKKNLTC